MCFINRNEDYTMVCKTITKEMFEMQYNIRNYSTVAHIYISTRANIIEIYYKTPFNQGIVLQNYYVNEECDQYIQSCRLYREYEKNRI